jgi:hypothetical protein
MIRLPKRFASLFESPQTKLPVVAGMATMPSRQHTLPDALRSIVGQVDRLYLYLDGFDAMPAAAKGDPRIIPIFSQDVPGLHGNGKFLGLTMEAGRCLYLGVDDDIAYPGNYVRALRAGLDGHGGRAIVGYHGVQFLEPFTSYLKSSKPLWFAAKLARPTAVDMLGSGTLIFDTGVLRFDVRGWPRTNMVDLSVALEAAAADLELICLPRRRKFLKPIEENQDDAIFTAMKRDDTAETELALQLRAMKSAAQAARSA